jgi:hypothetical protein
VPPLWQKKEKKKESTAAPAPMPGRGPVACALVQALGAPLAARFGGEPPVGGVVVAVAGIAAVGLQRQMKKWADSQRQTTQAPRSLQEARLVENPVHDLLKKLLLGPRLARRPRRVWLRWQRRGAPQHCPTRQPQARAGTHDPHGTQRINKSLKTWNRILLTRSLDEETSIAALRTSLMRAK